MEILKFYDSGKKISVQTTYPILKKKASEKIDKRKDENQEHG